MENKPNKTNQLSRNLTRRDFLKLGAMTFGVAATSGILAGCNKPSASENVNTDDRTETPEPTGIEQSNVDIQSGEHVWQPGELDLNGRPITIKECPPEAYDGWKKIEDEYGLFSFLAPADFNMMYSVFQKSYDTPLPEKDWSVQFRSVAVNPTEYDAEKYIATKVPKLDQYAKEIIPPYSIGGGVHEENLTESPYVTAVKRSWNTLKTPNASGKYVQVAYNKDQSFSTIEIALDDPGQKGFVIVHANGPQRFYDEIVYGSEYRELEELMKIIASIKFN